MHRWCVYAPAMLTIGKIGGRGGGSWRSPDYYTQQVAQGAEDYYSGRGEAPGVWVGSGAASLGLQGVVGDGEVQALFERRHPVSGDQLGRPPGVDAVKGIDLQMAVPKSVSALWALADEYGRPEVAAKVWEATHGAGQAALGYLERHACRSRAGRGGQIALEGEGFVGAAFAHRFSRAGDPQVHVHFLVANMTRCGDRGQGVPDGWRTLDARHLYAHRLAAGYVFQAELRERLTRELGVEWGEVRKGAAEVVGVPRALSVALSRRRGQILAQLERDGRAGSAREAELAALTTRRGKEQFDLDEQRSQWRAIAAEHGFDQAAFADTIGRTEFADLDRAELSEALAELTSAGGLTRERSTFARRDVVQALAAAHGRGGSVRRIEEAADRLIASDRLVAVEQPAAAGARLAGRASAAGGEARLTTAEMLDLEARMVDSAASRAGEGAAAVAAPDGEAFAHRPGGLVLSGEQQRMVCQVVGSGNGVDLVQARAGTGKTTAIDAAREMWQDAGYQVIGAALAGRAADELHARAGIRSYTIHGLLQELDRGGEWRLDSRTVVVVDEAGMVDSRRLAALLDHAADAHAKVVLIGDSHQVPAVDAGGGFAALADRLGAVELTEVFRQRHGWDRAALDELRHGDIAAWIDAYHHHGRLVACQDAEAQAQALVREWWVAAREHGHADAVMLAASRDDTAQLNQLARTARVAAGELDDTAALAVHGHRFAAGDRVLALRNRWLAGPGGEGKHLLRNGNRGTVTRVDRQAGELHVALDGGPAVVLAADYLADGHLSHGYAMTIHKAQGMTATRVFVLGSPDLARELGYVASSRHTDSARFYVNVGDDHDPDRPQLPGLEDQPLYRDLQRALGQQRAKQLAIDTAEIDTDLGQLTTAQLIEIRDRGQQLLRTIPLHAQRTHEAELLEQAASRAAATHQRLAAAQAARDQLRRFDRRRRDELDQQIARLQHALDTARAEVAERTDQLAAPDQQLADNEMRLVDAAAAERELAARRAHAHWHATRTVALDTDPAIEHKLGPRPDTPTDRDRWEQAAAAHESYRLQYGALPHDHDPTNLTGRQAADWHHTHRLADKLFDPPHIEALEPIVRPERAL